MELITLQIPFLSIPSCQLIIAFCVVNISHLCHQGNTQACADMSAASGLVCGDHMNGLGAGASVDNVVVSTIADDAVNH